MDHSRIDADILNCLHIEISSAKSSDLLRIATKYRDAHIERSTPVAAAIVSVAKKATHTLDDSWQAYIDVSESSRASKIRRLKAQAILTAFWSSRIVDYYEWSVRDHRFLETLARIASEHSRWSEFAQLLNLAMLDRHVRSLYEPRTLKIGSKGPKIRANSSQVYIQTQDLDFFGRRQHRPNTTHITQGDVENWVNFRFELIREKSGLISEIGRERLKHYCLQKDQYGLLTPLDVLAAETALKNISQESRAMRSQTAALHNLAGADGKKRSSLALVTSGSQLGSCALNVSATRAKRSKTGDYNNHDVGTSSDGGNDGCDDRRRSHDDDSNDDNNDDQKDDADESGRNSRMFTTGRKRMKPAAEDSAESVCHSIARDSIACGQLSGSKDHRIDSGNQSTEPAAANGRTTRCCEAWGHQPPPGSNDDLLKAYYWAQCRHKEIHQRGPDNEIICDSYLGWLKNARLADDGLDYIAIDANTLQDYLDKDPAVKFDKPLLIREDFRDKKGYKSEDFVERMKDCLTSNLLEVVSPFERPSRRYISGEELEDTLKKTAPGMNALSMSDFIGALPPTMMTVKRFEWLSTVLWALRVSDEKLAGKGIDVTECLKFNLFACPGAYSGPHLDSLCGTWIRPMSGDARPWMFILGDRMEQSDWADFEALADNWVPRPGLARLLFVPVGYSFVMPPHIPIVHAVGTNGISVNAGGMFWDEESIPQTLHNVNRIVQQQNYTNEPVQLDLYRVINMIEDLVRRKKPKIWSDPAFRHEIARFRQFCCSCKNKCKWETCRCMQEHRRCTKACFEHGSSALQCFTET